MRKEVRKNLSKPADPRVVKATFSAITIFLAPIIAWAFLRETSVGELLFGGVQIVLFYVIAYGVLYLRNPNVWKDTIDND